MAVVMQHFSTTAQKLCSDAIPSLVPHGYIAVDMFFILSGFIMSLTYLRSFDSCDLRQAYPDFLIRRVARVVPLNIAVLGILIFCGVASLAILGRNIFFQTDDLTADLIKNIFMLQGLGVGTNLNGPSWSISTEFAAYLLFPIFLACILSARRALCAGAMILSVSALCWVASLHARLGLDTDTTAEAVIRCFSEFAIGMGSYRIYRTFGQSELLRTDLFAFGIGAVCSALVILRIDLFTVFLFPLIIISLASNEGLASRLMSTRVVYFLGVVSYSVYLIHNAFRPVALELMHKFHPSPLSFASAIGFALIGSIVVIPFAWLTYSFIERPGREFVRRVLIRDR